MASRRVVRGAKLSVARVILDIPTRSLEEPFDYAIPESLEAEVALGCAVHVPFGARAAVGYVVALANSSPYADLKPIKRVLSEPLFDSQAVEIAMWIASEYVAPLADSMRLFLAPGSVPKVKKVATSSGAEWLLERPAVSERTERWVTLVPGANFEPRKGASRQLAVLKELAEGPLTSRELRARLGAVDTALRALESAGALVLEERRSGRRPQRYDKAAPVPDRLTAGQREALDALGTAKPGDVVLMDGITGSGKTEVYLQAAERLSGTGGGVIILVPEISLTPQTVGRFQTRLGDEVAVLHSRLSAGERFDEWERVRRGEANIVVGARSALFAPVHAHSLIVIDEEHEYSYKQGSAPRYHARDVAAFTAAVRGCVLLLGSATPSMESLERARQGEWTRVVLSERPGDLVLPPVEIIDMGAEFREGHRSLFSRRLADELRGVARREEKAVLLLNRRGFASFLLCRECGFVPNCDSCSTSMTLHESKGILACHHCAATRAVPVECPECGSVYLRAFGAGTQRVESELRVLLPDLPCVRMDADTTGGKGGHQARLLEFEAMDSGVLIGTQMVAKGLDYPEVTLVGVLNADTTLHMPDFRSAERTYQLLAQVSGRAGRGDAGGRVVIQTYWPSHPALQAAATHDSSELHEHERKVRSELGYPPFGRLANIVVSGTSDGSAKGHAREIAARLSETAPEDWSVLGPSRAPLARLKRSYRWHILLKAPQGERIPARIAQALRNVNRPTDVSVAVDVDPVDLM